MNAVALGSDENLRAETTWFHVFRSMFSSRDAARMGPYAVTVYLVIKAHANFNTGNSFPSIDVIADETGISRSQVIRVLKVLETFGYLKRTRAGRKNEYRLREQVSIRDGSGRQAAVATWDYLPTTVQAAMADLKNLILSGDFSGSRVVHIERLQINVTQAAGDVITINSGDFDGLPREMREALLSLHTKLVRSEAAEEVVHSSD
ncbi:helix-turn-helix domain-containing protein [Cupriavidus malaysiensis]|uniref:Helix-turn-helix domain-containing protein n=1 Tax=Cupriavidus malaysiensis TaxID=367825 RepID=A0ABM6F7Y2_9BURK|nr:helix-turn-helix domain-containing protein [Cupriavidus malaysiensis]AOZ07727.1 helix-turn-helix domain-containing protein [Cupriavidus malaysiensis]